MYELPFHSFFRAIRSPVFVRYSPQWMTRVVAWATAEPTEVDHSSWRQLQTVYSEGDATSTPSVRIFSLFVNVHV